MNRAKNGGDNYEKSVAMAFRRRVVKDQDFDPGWIDFDELKLSPIQALDSVP